MSDEEIAASVAKDLKRITSQDGWKSNDKTTSDLNKLLVKVFSIQKVDVDLLRKTKIGAMVAKLKKHENETIRGYSNTLTNKWRSQVGLSSSNNASNSRSASISPVRSDYNSNTQLENARKRVQEKYASEKAKKDSRTIQFINNPIPKKRRGTIISAAPSRRSSSTVNQLRLNQARAITATASSHPSSISSQTRSASVPTNRSLTREELHEQRQRKYRALALRNQSKINTSVVKTSSRESRTTITPSASNPRKEMLDRLYPRICGRPAHETIVKKDSKKSAGAQTTGKGKQGSYSEEQREVVSWLKGLAADMSEYAPTFFENGFDSMKLLTTIEESDLPSLVPKKGHHRAILLALKELKRKQFTSISDANRESRKAPLKRRQKDDLFCDFDSDDSFIVDDSDDYRPGAIAALVSRGRRKRSYSYDDYDNESSDMEASFEEMQDEERRTSRIGKFIDHREDLRNKGLLKKK